MAVGQLDSIVQFLHAMARKGASESLTDSELLHRFIRQRDELAFLSLVQRHGPMVLGVCGRVLGRDQDLEDAFQATFLVLVRKAATLRSPSTIANWLYGVANRTALEMKRAGAKRRAKEAKVMPRSESISELPADFHTAIDEELAQLPDKYREAVVLCDLQSRTRRQAAQDLGCAEGTVGSRLARGRALLAQRLTRRGFGASAVTLAASLLGETARAQVPGLLASTTTRTAGLLAAGQPLDALVSTNVAAAIEGVLKSMFLFKFKSVALALALLAISVCTAGYLHATLATDDAISGAPGNSAPPGSVKEADESLFASGKVVDEQGNPVSGVLIKTEGRFKPFLARSSADGKFRIELEDWPVHPPLTAEAGDGKLGILELDADAPKTGLRIKLQAARDVNVKVVNAQGLPVAGSQVVLVLDDGSTNFGGVTGADGAITLRYPREAKPAQVFAFKSGVGFDYLSTLIAKRQPERRPLPTSLSLKLDGARTVRVKAIDSAGRPLSGISIVPWYVGKPGTMEQANIAGCESVHVKTDASGVATFDWLPVEFNNAIPFLCNSPAYSYTEQVAIKREAPVEELTTLLLRNTKISGKAVWPDGRPASGILIEASGAGNVGNGGGRVRTRSDGTYQMLVNSEQAYIATVIDDRWAAASHMDVLVREDKPVAGLDFTLTEGAVLHGKVTVGAAKRPAAGEYISVGMSGGQIPKGIRKPGDRTYHEIRIFRGKTTDAAGEYRLCLGPGTYQVVLRSQIGEPKTITVGKERELVQDFHMPRSEWGTLNGLVIDQHGRPVAGAAISGAYMRPTGYVDPECISGADGIFKVKRVQVPTALFATTADRKLAGIVRIDADQEAVTICVNPTARARGRLLSADGQIIANSKLQCGIRIPDGDGPRSSHRYCFGSGARSGADGRYLFDGLTPGEEYEANMGYEPESGRLLYFATMKAQAAETLDLGDTRVNQPLRPPRPE